MVASWWSSRRFRETVWTECEHISNPPAEMDRKAEIRYSPALIMGEIDWCSCCLEDVEIYGIYSLAIMTPHQTSSIYEITRKKERTEPDSRRYWGGDFLQWTAGNLRRKLKFRDMGFFQKIPIYQTREAFAEKSERFRRFSRCSEHVFSRCGQLKSSREFLLWIDLIEQQNFLRERGGVRSL